MITIVSSRVGVLVLSIVVLIAVGCGPSKPTLSDYVGHWEGTYRGDLGGEYACHLEVSVVGQSAVVKSEDQTFRPCETYAQVYSVNTDGTLKGGPMGAVTLLFDKAKDEIIVSGLPTSRNLKRNPSYHSVKDGLSGTWKKVPKDGGQMLTDILIVELSNDGLFRIREKDVMDNADFRNVVYDNGTIRGTFHMAVDREWTSPFEIRMSGANVMTYKDQRGEESFAKQ